MSNPKPVLSSTAAIQAAAEEVINTLIQQLPYDAQDDADREAATHHALQLLDKRVSSRIRKLDEAVKSSFRDGSLAAETETKAYSRHISLGTPRRIFNADQFINLIAETYPDIPKHKLRTLAEDDRAYKTSAAPVSISYDLRDEL